MSGKVIRPVRKEDSKAICEIYNFYVENTNISFEENKVSEDEMEQRIQKITKEYPWIVYEIDGKVVGYAYVGQWKERSAYRFTAEDTIYVKNDNLGMGIGKVLLTEIIKEIKKKDIHIVMAVIALPNDRSISLHEQFGFKKAAHFKEVGYKNSQWIDVGYWEFELNETK
jgi:phosphinothricin acetyltransferase